MLEPIIGAAIILAFLFAGATMTRAPDDEPTPPTLGQDLLLALALVYILRYLRQHRLPD